MNRIFVASQHRSSTKAPATAATIAFASVLLVCIALTGSSALYAADDCKLSSYGTLPVEMMAEEATTTAKINGQDTRFVLDTGASYNSMSRVAADALQLRRIGLPSDFRGLGIGGGFSLQLVQIKDFELLGAKLRNIEFLVGGSDTGTPLIGANLLDIVDLDVDLAHGNLRLMKPEGRDCDKFVLAYWTKKGDFQVADLRRSDNPRDRRSFVTVLINGKSVRALLDTGAYATLLTRRAAESAGVNLNLPGAENQFKTHGLGAKSYRTWTVPIDAFSVGTELIQHSKMLVLDGDIGGDADMLLGVDFFLAHHLFIANSQRKMYFTYNGGRVFSLAPGAGEGEKTMESPAEDKDAPKTAEEYARRGQAHLSRGQPKAALADLDNAIRMAPEVAASYLARARVHLDLKQNDAATNDLDKSIELDSRNLEALLLRATQRIEREDRSGAQSDIAAARQLAAPGSNQALTIADLYDAIDQPGSALPLLDDWIRVHRNDSHLGSVLNARCWARALTNQMLEDALDDCRTAIKRDGANSVYLDSLGLVQLRLKNYPEAIKAYEQILAERPKAAWSKYGLGIAKIRSGRINDGNADMDAAEALDAGIAKRFALLNI